MSTMRSFLIRYSDDFIVTHFRAIGNDEAEAIGTVKADYGFTHLDGTFTVVGWSYL